MVAQNQLQREEEVFFSLYQHIKSLVKIPSITPEDLGCQQYLIEQLELLGFQCEQFVDHRVSNLVATIGTGDKRIAFAGHTDVVPTGDKALWRVDPFGAQIIEQNVYGRGTADMKGGIACMLSAITTVLPQLDLNTYTLMFLVTSDEEGEAEYGTQSIIKWLAKKKQIPQWCIVGEPTADQVTGDVIKVGRRGAISAELSIAGKQGHVAYPQFACNAAHIASDVASWLNHLSWDQGSEDFPGTSLQITGIDSGQWTDNIIPGRCALCFNVRYSHHYTEQEIKGRISSGLQQLPYQIAINWQRPCIPYFTDLPVDANQNEQLDLITAVEQTIYSVCQRFPRLSTSGGTSDGRFFAEAGSQVVELGVPNRTIHQIDEHVAVSDFVQLEAIYAHLLVRIMGR